MRRRHRGPHADLQSRGVPISSIKHHDGTGFAEGKGDDWNSFIFFDDPDGNSWAIQESPTMRDAAKATRRPSSTLVVRTGVGQPTPGECRLRQATTGMIRRRGQAVR